MRECQPARTTEIRALQVGEHLVVAVAVELPTPGFDVEIQQAMTDVEPPSFAVLRCARPGAWPRVVDQRREAAVFRVGTRRDEVVVGDEADPERRVPVEDLFDVEPGAAARLAPSPAPAEEAVEDEAVGMSPNLSFDEAFADAIAKLGGGGRVPALIPDDLQTVTVVDVSALFGGIAGFHHLVVRVRR